MSNLKRIFIALVLAALAFPGDRAVAETEGPRQTIERFHTTLLAAARNPALGYSGRYERLMAEVEQTFHLPVMTQISAGSFWNDAQAFHRQALIVAFTHYGSVSLPGTSRATASSGSRRQASDPGRRIPPWSMHGSCV